MWAAIKKHFSEYPAQEKVAMLLLKRGLSVKEGRIYCDAIELPPAKMARAIGVDRRAVTAAAGTISKNPELKRVYADLQATAYFNEVAQKMGWGVIKIIPTDPALPGILAGVAAIMAKESIQIRQAVTEDPELAEEATMTVITEKPIPPRLIPRLKAAKGVKSILIL